MAIEVNSIEGKAFIVLMETLKLLDPSLPIRKALANRALELWGCVLERDEARDVQEKALVDRITELETELKEWERLGDHIMDNAVEQFEKEFPTKS